MAKKSYTNLKGRAGQIKNETVESANSATRVGSFDEDLNDSSIQEYDPGPVGWTDPIYVSGQIVFFQGYLAQAVDTIYQGESPSSAPTKWSSKIALKPEQIALGNFSPVSAHALKKFVNEGGFGGSGDIPNADTETFGKARRASGEEYTEGAEEPFATPAQVKGDIEAINLALSKLLGIDKLDLQAILANGSLADIMPYFNGGMAAVLEETTIDFAPVVIGDDNVLYKKVITTTRPPLEVVILNQLEEKDEKVGVGIFRLADDSHNDPLQVTEGGTLQLRLEEQQSDDSWEITTIPRTYALESATPGATIPAGLLTIPANSISANATLTVKATLADSSVVEAPVNVININPADSVDVDAPNADWKGLQGIRREILVEPSNPSFFWVRYLIKSGVNIDNEVTYGTEAPYRSTLNSSLASSEGYTREGGISSVEPNKVITNRFFYEGSSVVLFEQTITVAATSPLTVVYTA